MIKNHLEISIIYEDDSVLVLDKPTGLIVHSDGKTKELTLVDWIVERYPEMQNVGEPITLSSGEVINRSGIVHRIDRETSGAIIVAKKQEVFLHLKGQFQERSVRKEYLAFVYGEMKNDKGVIDRDIGRSGKDFRLWSAQRGARGKLRDAITEYSVHTRANGYSYISVFPKTGRTHQIRVHLKAINYPVICDKLYAPKRECALGFTRLALHAYRIELEIPNIGIKSFESPLPKDFEEAVKILKIS